jgi:serine/threonine protein kinase
MTGNTGSLRYMAPEVALRRPYSEKADVYSFGILVWQVILS